MNNSKQLTQRDISLDIVGGILIVYMVLMHLFVHFGLTDDTFYRITSRLLSFFMAWFFFKAGMFYKQGDNKEIFAQKFNRLIVPLVVYTLIGYVVYAIKALIENYISSGGGYELIKTLILFPGAEIITIGAIHANAPLWFLVSLFGVIVIYNYLLNRKVNNTLIICLSLAVPFILHLLKFPRPVYIMNIPLGIFFFAMGRLLKEKQYNKILSIISIIIYILILVFIPSSVDFRTNKLVSGYYLIWVISSLAGIISFDFVFKKIGKIISITHIQHIGKRSMDYYVWHFILMFFSEMIYKDIFHVEDSYTLFFLTVITLILLFPICFIISKKWLQISVNFNKKTNKSS